MKKLEQINFKGICTVIFITIDISGIVLNPRINLDKFGNEARNVALDNCGIPTKDMFVHHVHCITLPHNCNQTPGSELLTCVFNVFLLLFFAKKNNEHFSHCVCH